jgi:CHASE2 domain-containing sensor protein
MSSSAPSDPHPADPIPPEHWALRRLRVFWLVVPLIVILGALMMSDLGDFMGYSPFASNQCALADTGQSSISAKMYMPIAKWALRYTPTPSVAIIYIDPAHDPPDLLTNVCASRAFLARLVPDLNALGAQAIVIDKYYSAAGCAEQDKNAAFIQAMDNSKIPVVVGQATDPLSGDSSAAGCLALTPKLEFSPTSKVRYGLTRIDTDVLRIPLRFQVFAEPAENGTAPDGSQPTQSSPPAPKPLPDAAGDTLSLVAAKAVDPHLESNPVLRTQLAKQADPYTTFFNLPHITALTALCSAESSPRADIDGQPGDALCKPWTRDPNNLNGHQLSLNSKIVVIGDLSGLDMKPFPSDLAPFPPGQRPGVFLQANYIQALLDHRFLLEVPMPLTVGVVVLYVFAVYCLYWAHDEHGIARLTANQAGLASLAVLTAIVLISFLALVTTSYFTPLWALWGAGVFMVFRFLEAKGHHRSQHLLGHLAGQHHAASPANAAAPPAVDDPNHPEPL